MPSGFAKLPTIDWSLKIIVSPTTKPEKENNSTGTNIAAPNFWKLALKSIFANILYPPNF